MNAVKWQHILFSEQSSDEEDTGETSPRIESKETLPVNGNPSQVSISSYILLPFKF